MWLIMQDSSFRTVRTVVTLITEYRVGLWTDLEQRLQPYRRKFDGTAYQQTSTFASSSKEKLFSMVIKSS